MSEAELLETSRNNRGIRIIANNSQVQAVSNDKEGIYQIVFYTAGEVQILDNLKVRMDSPGMAMVKMQGDEVKELTVSDPSRKLGRMMVTLTGSYDVTGGNFMTMSDSDLNGTLVIADLPRGVYAGQSATLKLN